MISACSGDCDVPARRRYAPHEFLEQFGHACAGLGADEDRVGGLDADDVLDLLDHAFGLGRRQVDLVDDRHAPRGPARAPCSSSRRSAPPRPAPRPRPAARPRRRRANATPRTRSRRARRVDEVELVVEPVRGPVVERDGLRLDRDAALALEVHRVEHLFLHLARLETAAGLDQAVGQRRLAVVDVRNDREIAYLLLHRGKRDALAGPARPGKRDYTSRRAPAPVNAGRGAGPRRDRGGHGRRRCRRRSAPAP